MIALSVVILIQVVGIILVVALLTIPSVISLMLWKDLRSVLARLGRGSASASPSAGSLLSFHYDLPSGPAIILLGAVLLVGVYGGKKIVAARPLLER